MKTTMAEHQAQTPRLKNPHRKRSDSMNDKEKDKRPLHHGLSKGRRASVDGTCLGLGKLSISCHNERFSPESTEKRVLSTEKRCTISTISKKDTGHKESHFTSQRKSPSSTELKPILKQGYSSSENVSSSSTIDKKLGLSVQENKFCYRLPVFSQPTIRKTVSFKEDELSSSAYTWPPRRYSSPILQKSSDFDYVNTNPLLGGCCEN